MGIIFGGDKAWKVKRSGQLVVAFHWVNREPSMVLSPARRPPDFGTVDGPHPVVLPLSLAWTYADRDGYASAMLVPRGTGAWRRGKAARFAKEMGLNPGSWHDVMGIATAIVYNLEDLVHMPPEPRAFAEAATQAVGDATLMLGGDKMAEEQFLAPPEDEYVPDSPPRTH